MIDSNSKKEKAEKNNKIFVGSKGKTCLIAKGVQSFIFFADLPCFYFDRLRKQLWAKCVFSWKRVNEGVS